jgi:hypothetical protein
MVSIPGTCLRLPASLDEAIWHWNVKQRGEKPLEQLLQLIARSILPLLGLLKTALFRAKHNFLSFLARA